MKFLKEKEAMEGPDSRQTTNQMFQSLEQSMKLISPLSLTAAQEFRLSSQIT